MREILFRGKHTKTGKWAYGLLWHHTEVSASSLIYSDELDTKVWVHSETVGQYTGMTDRNGKKIFEGDIVRFDNGIFVVVFYESRIGFGFSGRFGRGLVPGFTMANWEHIEVIGNIHDNPELLEVSEDGT